LHHTGPVLSLMKGSGIYPETFHISFGQESEAKVNPIYEVLKADGFDVAAPERVELKNYDSCLLLEICQSSVQGFRT
jgi:hypothetical protein